MPIYEYKCMICDYRITQTQSINENENKPVCINCNKNMDRVFTIQTIIFKGNGWGKDA
jgi:putative FmdB family regulatory protein